MADKTIEKAALIKAFAAQGLEIKPAYRVENGIPFPNWLDDNGQCVPGIYDGIPNEEYHRSPAVSNSQLKTFRESPAHYWYAYLDPEREKEEVKRPDYFVIGDLLHALCLEPDEVYDRYYCALNVKEYPAALRTAPEIEKALQAAGQPKKKSGEKKADQVARLKETCPDIQVWDDLVQQHAQKPEHEGKIEISYDIWRKAHRALTKVMERAEAKVLLSDGLAELSIFAVCPDTGMMLKARPDWLRLNFWIIDVKSATSAKPSFWSKKAADLGYHCQDAFYRYVFKLATDKDPEGFGFITIEYEKAAICEPYEIDEAGKEAGDKQVHRDLGGLAACKEKDYWPGYTAQGVTPLKIAKWATEVH